MSVRLGLLLQVEIVRNVRRYFRLDVQVPAVVKLADKDEVIRMVLPELAGGAWHPIIGQATL